MPEFTIVQVGFLAMMVLVGVILGWILRGDRCAKEKIAVNASWQQQIDAQQSEHDRLSAQNVSLMEQIGQYQASNKDSNLRARELSDALKEAFERRDELQRSLKEVRSELELITARRDKLQDEVDNSNMRGEATADALKEKDDKIFRLSRELTSWQSRVPPLVEKFKERDQEVAELKEALDGAHEALENAHEALSRTDGTRIEPLDADTLPDGLDASNEPHDATLTGELSIPEDQIDPDRDFDEVAAVTAVDNEGEQADADETEQQEDGAGDEIAAGDDDEHDDLKLIKGVGPAIEKTLNGLGIYRFNQIAEMSEYDIDRVAQQLRGFRSRIYREDWIGQARTLQYQKNNENS